MNIFKEIYLYIEQVYTLEQVWYRAGVHEYM
jgi:hypothetical protein